MATVLEVIDTIGTDILEFIPRYGPGVFGLTHHITPYRSF